MPRITLPGFIGGAYEGRSTVLDPQQCVNFYPEINREGGKSRLSLIGTPGMTVFSSLGSSAAVRNMLVVGDYLYAVIGNQLRKIDSDGAITSISGTLGTTTGFVFMAHDGSNLMVVDPDQEGYTYDTVGGGNLTAIADGDFPTPTSLTWSDGYFIVSKQNSGQFFISASYDPTSWGASDYATAEFKADELECVFAHRRNLYLIGEDTTEVWYNSGASDFPYDPISGGLIPYGTPARASVAEGDNALFWLTQSEQGAIVAVRVDGIAPRRISTTQIEYQWSTYSDIYDAVGFFYTHEGHGFYVLTFPTGDATWVYDVSTGFWHERRSFPQLASGLYGRHRCNCYAYFNNKHLVGDHTNGKIYEWSLDAYDDHDGEIVAIRVSQPVHAEGRRFKTNSIQIDFEAGVGTGTGTDKVSGGSFGTAAHLAEWTAGNSASLATAGSGKLGNCLQITENGDNNPYAYQAIDVISGWKYTLYAYVKAGTEATYQVKVYDVTNAADLYDSTATEETAGDWSTEVTNEVTVPDDCTQVQIQLYQIASSGAGTTLLFDSVSFYATQGEDPQAMLSWSDDGGRTYGNTHQRDIGESGEYTTRAIWRKLGMARNRVFKLQISDPVKRVITDAYADIEAMNH